MANQVPVGKGPTYFSGPEAAFLIEAASPTVDLTADGELIFKDVSRPDSLNVSTTVTASRSSGNPVPLSNAELLAALTTSLHENNGDVRGEIDWDFSLLNADVNFLAAGEKLTLTYQITFTDPSGGSATQSVTVQILGVNHPPVFTSGPETGSVTELADTTGSATLDTTPTGTLAFTDQDTGDTHTVAVSVDSATSSGGSAIPATTLADLGNALATTLNDSTGTGSGSVNWTFSIPDSDLDFLSAGETLTTVYDVKVSDGSGASATQTVTITAVGANDPVTITSGPESGAVAEQPDVTGSPTPDTSAPGTLSFTDADLDDTHTVTVNLDSAVWSVNPFFVPGQTLADLQSALATTLSDSTGTGAGSVNWSFSIPDKDLDFLGAGDTLTATYDVTVSDGAGSSSTQNVVITMTGAQDPLVVNPVTAAISDTQFPDTGTVIGVGNVIFDGQDTGGDLSTTLSVTAVNGLASNVDGLVAGTFGSLFVDSSGFYEYIANSSVDPLTIGDNVTDQFNFTVTDSLGRTETATLTFNIAGTDDAPVITSADTIGAMTEDAGPSTVVNGGFETGDLTGWSASSSDISTGFFALGGAFGNFAAVLGPGSSQSLSQNVATTPGQQYTLSFVVDGDPDASVSPLTVTWDGVTILSLAQVPLGFNQYTFTVTGDASAATTALSFNYSDDGGGILLDEVAVNANTSPATENAQGTISFSDAETGDTHTASFQPVGGGYVGTFSLDPVSEVPGSGSVQWHFSVDNSAIQFLSQGQTLTQDYLVTVTDENGASVVQDVTIAINGSNDPPTAMADNVITDAGTSGLSFIPGWTLTHNDTDPDTNDTLNVNSVTGSSGGTAFASPPDGVFFLDDGTLGGQFSYDVTDGFSTSGPATVTFDNNAATSTTLTGTSGDDIIIGDNAGETLSGGAGNDILVANAGNQTLTGGSGNDIFAFEQVPSSPATITDFNNTTEQDQIAISASGFGGGLTPGVDLSTLFETSADNQFSGLGSLFHFDTANQTLYYSADGTTGSEAAVVELQAGPTLQANNLLIVH